MLRPWRIEDVPAVAAACRDPEIPRWIPFVPEPYTDEDARFYVQDCIDAPEDRRPFAITDAETGQVIGSIDMRINRMATGHIGYWLAAEARGRGVTTAALRALSRWAIEDAGLGRLELMTDPDNSLRSASPRRPASTVRASFGLCSPMGTVSVGTA